MEAPWTNHGSAMEASWTHHHECTTDARWRHYGGTMGTPWSHESTMDPPRPTLEESWGCDVHNLSLL